MSAPFIEFPLSICPVVRSREAGSPDGDHVPYHAAIWIVDRDGRTSAANGLALRPIIAVHRQGRTVEAGVQFCSAPAGEFDRVTMHVT